MRAWTMTLMAAAALVASPPLAAQSMLKPAPTDTSTPRQKLVTVFGTDPCPKASSKDEIVVCTRLPEDPARIPLALRNGQKPQSPFSQNRKLLLGDSSGGAGGSVGSCSPVGPGGATGCQVKANEAWGGVPR